MMFDDAGTYPPSPGRKAFFKTLEGRNLFLKLIRGIWYSTNELFNTDGSVKGYVVHWWLEDDGTPWNRK